jgi:hypothetical protein
VIAFEDRVERELKVLERLDRDVEADADSAQHEVRDAEERAISRHRQDDLVGHLCALLSWIERGTAARRFVFRRQSSE